MTAQSTSGASEMSGRGRYRCALCDHVMTFDRCGFAGATENGERVHLCHADDHDCYHAWTLYDTRPDSLWPRHGCQDDPRVSKPNPIITEMDKLAAARATARRGR